MADITSPDSGGLGAAAQEAVTAFRDMGAVSAGADVVGAVEAPPAVIVASVAQLASFAPEEPVRAVFTASVDAQPAAPRAISVFRSDGKTISGSGSALRVGEEQGAYVVGAAGGADLQSPRALPGNIAELLSDGMEFTLEPSGDGARFTVIAVDGIMIIAANNPAGIKAARLNEARVVARGLAELRTRRSLGLDAVTQVVIIARES